LDIRGRSILTIVFITLTIVFVALKIAFVTLTIFIITLKIFFVIMKIVFVIETIFFRTKTAVRIPETIFTAIETIVFVIETTVFGIKKIVSEAKSIFFASETDFSIMEKTIAAASMLVQFMGSFGNLRCSIDRLFGHRQRNAPPYHHNLYGVVHNEAGDHGITQYSEHLPPRQWHEARETHQRQTSTHERVKREGRHEGLAGHRRPEPPALPRRHDGEDGKVEQG
jgi:hypothetical protein